MSYQGPGPNQGQYPGSGQYNQFGQPGHQQPGYPPPYGGPQQGSTSMGMAQNTAAGLSYIFGWITGLIFFLREKQNRFVRFHAMQSILLSGGITLLSIIVNVLQSALYSSGLAVVISGIWSLIALVFFITWIVTLVNAFRGKYFKLPVIGNYAERYANQGMRQ